MGQAWSNQVCEHSYLDSGDEASLVQPGPELIGNSCLETVDWTRLIGEVSLGKTGLIGQWCLELAGLVAWLCVRPLQTTCIHPLCVSVFVCLSLPFLVCLMHAVEHL